jgi:antitoxin VapB
MALQIANPTVVAKVERLAKITGLSKTALVERAVDQLERQALPARVGAGKLRALLAQMDQLAASGDSGEALSYDDHGLPN